MNSDCELCTRTGEVVWQDELCRVILAEEPLYPGFCRVVWKAHVAEMTDLAAPERRHLMRVVNAVEVALRVLWRPDKINLASLGNMVPHLHWHVIPRFVDDAHFPRPVWAQALRADSPARPAVTNGALHQAIVSALAEDEA